MDWRLVLSTASGWFLRRDWQDGMGGGGTLDGDELSSSWTEHEGDPVLNNGGIRLRCPWPVGKEQ